MLQLWIIFILTEFVTASSFTNSTETCKRVSRRRTSVRAGESLYLRCPNLACYEGTENSTYFWFRNSNTSMQLEQIGTEESERVHYHKSVLYILHLRLDDTGCYMARWWYSEKQYNEYEIDIVVYEEFNSNLLHSEILIGYVLRIRCPVCTYQKGTFIWYKNFSLISDQESDQTLRIRNASKEHEGIYTCVCTWEHHGKKYNTSGFSELQILEQSFTYSPKFSLPSNNSIEMTDLGAEMVLTCSVYFGINVRDQVSVYWERNGVSLDEVAGYNCESREENGMFQSVLTISKVSQADLNAEFCCNAEDENEIAFVSVFLKKRDSAPTLQLILGFVCTFLFFLAIIATVKWFALDLILFLRAIFIKLNKKEDGKLYDAYVIYQRNNLNETATNFVNEVLPAVLESCYSFKLYIHGRDDLPGEDCMNMIETKIKLSRRLIFILTPGASTDKNIMFQEAYDMEVGLHQALVQGETGVILIQVGEIQDYTHLPLGLQHLLQKNSPLLWRGRSPQAASPNSKFWKQVRYRMPVPSRQRSNLKNKALGFSCKDVETENGETALLHSIV